MTIGEKIAALQCGKPNSLYIEFNDYWGNHDSIEDAVAEIDPTDFVSVEEREASLKSGNLWSVQWYYLTSIGFAKVYASTLDACLDDLLEWEAAGRP